MDAITAITKGPEFTIEGLGESTSAGGTGAAGGTGNAFGRALSDSIGKLDEMHASADGQAQALATGKTDDVASVVSEIERAALAMQLAVQVRNKAVDAYHELFRMPV
jgi:flagellar hook-basal body complex protein FliE